jgi:hypothetical protein
VETTDTLAPGTPVELVVRTEDLRLSLSGKIHASHPGFGMGVEFLQKTQHQRDQIKQLIACAESQETAGQSKS